MGWARQFAERPHFTPLTALRGKAGESVPAPLALAKLRKLEQEVAASRTTL